MAAAVAELLGALGTGLLDSYATYAGIVIYYNFKIYLTNFI